MTSISLKLPEELLAQLESAARTKRMTKSQLVRESLERSLNAGTDVAGGSCYDLARDLAGAVKGLPKDIATNPRHLAGFGR